MGWSKPQDFIDSERQQTAFDCWRAEQKRKDKRAYRYLFDVAVYKLGLKAMERKFGLSPGSIAKLKAKMKNKHAFYGTIIGEPERQKAVGLNG